MANSKYAYVKRFESESVLLAETYIVVRVDGRGFGRFCAAHELQKPVDMRGIGVINAAAASVMREFADITLAFGHSDEFSFVFRPSTTIFNRRRDKILSCVVSHFSSAYVFHWNMFFKNHHNDDADHNNNNNANVDLKCAPSFDGRVVLYPSVKHVRDYLAWRQVDAHINNQYNSAFWALVLRGGLSEREAQATLRGTLADEKNEILFSRFGINYNNLPKVFRKGTTLFRLERNSRNPVGKGDDDNDEGDDEEHCETCGWCCRLIERQLGVKNLKVQHGDIIRDAFWTQHPHLL